MRSHRALVLLALAACYDTYRVRPDELPKLNDSHTTVMGALSTGKTTAVFTDRSVRHLFADDGRVVEVKGEASVLVRTVDGRAYDFEHPVLATLTDDRVLEIAGGNRAETSVPLVDVRTADVTCYSPEKSMWAAIGISTLVSIPLALLAVAAAHH
jgi:hypothetical protein